ncbi:uncharacterized protein ISCGN_024304 [Ixodes scapularis]
MMKDWVHIKSGWQKDDPSGMVKAKQRIRAAFSKSPHLKCIYKCNRYRIYQIRHIKGLLIGQAAWSDTRCREWHDVISVTSSPPRPRPWQEHENPPCRKKIAEPTCHKQCKAQSELLKSTRQTERSLKKKKKKRHSPGRLYRTTFCLPIVNPLGPPTPHEIFLSTGDSSATTKGASEDLAQVAAPPPPPNGYMLYWKTYSMSVLSTSLVRKFVRGVLLKVVTPVSSVWSVHLVHLALLDGHLLAHLPQNKTDNSSVTDTGIV